MGYQARNKKHNLVRYSQQSKKVLNNSFRFCRQYCHLWLRPFSSKDWSHTLKHSESISCAGTSGSCPASEPLRRAVPTRFHCKHCQSKTSWLANSKCQHLERSWQWKVLWWHGLLPGIAQARVYSLCCDDASAPAKLHLASSAHNDCSCKFTMHYLLQYNSIHNGILCRQVSMTSQSQLQLAMPLRRLSKSRRDSKARRIDNSKRTPKSVKDLSQQFFMRTDLGSQASWFRIFGKCIALHSCKIERLQGGYSLTPCETKSRLTCNTRYCIMRRCRCWTCRGHASNQSRWILHRFRRSSSVVSKHILYDMILTSCS